MQISMDGRGRALDNVFVERLWRSVKYEEVYLKDYNSVPAARAGGLLRVLQSRATAPGAGVSDARGGVRRGSCGGARQRTVRMLMGTGRGHVEISQTRFPQAHTLLHLNMTETTLTSSIP